MELADKEVIRVMRRLGTDGNSLVNVATKDHVVNPICAGTPGAYLWRPNTEQEAAAVTSEFNQFRSIFIGANDFDEDGIYTFDTENSSFAFNALPFGTVSQATPIGEGCVMISLENGIWKWLDTSCRIHYAHVICEYPR
ncbi:Hypothetical predicted protein, partial [Mytilus galloprovincialis]